MTRCERVKAAIRHQTPDHTPSCIHLAGDGIAAYMDRLYDRYTDRFVAIDDAVFRLLGDEEQEPLPDGEIEQK